MANLLGQNIGTNYKGILNLGSTINTPVSGTLQAVTDGDGLASALNVSTASVAVSGTLGVTGDVSIADKIIHTGDTNTAIRFPADDTIALETAGAERIRIKSGGSMDFSATDALAEYFFGFNRPNASSLFVNGDNNNKIRIQNAEVDIVVLNSNGNSYFNGGSVGIGTITPAVPLDVVGNIRTSTGILFGSDTAAANLLDDYEEGTWTMGVSFGGASVGVTTINNTGTYTKIGRQVTVNGYLFLSSKGTSTGDATITGLPFAIPNNNANFSAVSLWFNNITFANQLYANGTINTTRISLQECTEAGVGSTITNADFSDSSSIILSFTYFV